MTTTPPQNIPVNEPEAPIKSPITINKDTPPFNLTPISTYRRIQGRIDFAAQQPTDHPDYVVDEQTLIRHLIGTVGPLKNPILKRTCRALGLKVGGNKNVLIERLANKWSTQQKLVGIYRATVNIQRNQNKIVLRKIRRLSGIEYLTKCVNETDFATLEDIADINQKYLICVKDAGGSYYAFDIRSLVEYIMTEIGSGRQRYSALPPKISNPFNRQEFPETEMQRVAEFSKQCADCKTQSHRRILSPRRTPGQREINLATRQQLRSLEVTQRGTRPGTEDWFRNIYDRISRGDFNTINVGRNQTEMENLFTEVETHGFYTNSTIFTQATSTELRDALRLFNFVPVTVLNGDTSRLANIINIRQNDIRNFSSNMRIITHTMRHSPNIPQTILINLIVKFGELFVTRGIDDEHRQTGTIIFLTILANSIRAARESYPFLVFEE